MSPQEGKAMTLVRMTLAALAPALFITALAVLAAAQDTYPSRRRPTGCRR